jgi:hypothetical protein
VGAKAVWGLVVALLALAVMSGGAAVAHLREDFDLFWEAIGLVPAGALLALVAISLGRRARFEYQRTVRRSTGRVVATLAVFLGVVALLVAITAALALVVFAVLTFALD